MKPRGYMVRSALALLLLCLPLLAACSSGASQGTATTSTAVADATTPTREQSPSPTTLPTAVDTVVAPPATVTAPDATNTVATTAVPDATDTATVAPATATTAPTEASTTAPTTEATADSLAGVGASMADPLQFGVVAHLYYTDRNRVLDLAGFANFDWIRQQVPWKDTEKADRTCGCEELDQIVEAVNAKNKKLLLSFVKSPAFITGSQDTGLPPNPEDFGRFMTLLLNRYKGKIHAVEVWNEQNLAVENGGNVTPEDAGHYVEVLKAGYTAIKAIDPSVIVVAGGLSSTGENNPARAVEDVKYLKAMYDYNNGEIKNYMDVQGFHPSNTLNSPDQKFGENQDPNAPGWNDHPTHFFRHIEDVRAVMEESGMGNFPVWITEIGWATQNNTPEYEYGNQISFEKQADYLEGAFERIKQHYPYVKAVFIWNLNFAVTWNEQNNPLHEQASFGLLNPDYSPRPAFTRIQGWINANKSSQ